MVPMFAMALMALPARAQSLAAEQQPAPAIPMALDGVAQAEPQAGAPLPTAPLPTASLAGTNGNIYQRPYLMELNLRGRYMTLPDSIMDIWFFSEDEEGANPLPRPKTRGYAVGVEYVLKPKPSNWIIYFEYVGNTMDDGYWDDREKPADHEDGDYIRPDGFGIVAFGGDYAHEFEIKPWVSFLVGGGLGVGIITGELTQWSPGGLTDNTQAECLPSAAAYERVDICEDDGPKIIPGILPMVDINASFRFNLGDQANIRIEGGLHDLIYAGVAGGITF